MNYVEIVNLVFSILYLLFAIFNVHYVILALIGLIAKKKFPKAKVQHKYGIIIPARNEEKVVGNLIKSIQKTDYPQDKLQIFVIAHNCTDQTAQICRELGATVYEYNNPNECTMGYAFRHLFDRIREDYGVENYDGFFLFNADNILSKNYFEKMNDAFDATNGESVITSYRNSKNFGTNLISGLYGVYFAVGCLLESRGRTAVGCSARVQGTGYVINSKLVANGWPYVTLTEDWEFTADQIIHNTPIQYCDDAVFYDEQPTSFRVMWRQRVRWSRGHFLACFTRFWDVLKSFFGSHKKHPNKGSLYDFFFIYVIPVCLLGIVVNALQIILLMFAPLFGLSMGAALLGWLQGFGWSCLGFYVYCWLQSVAVFIWERKRIKGVSFGKKVLISLVWPLFIALEFIIDVEAVFHKCGWKTIPHDDTTDFEQLDQMHPAQ